MSVPSPSSFPLNRERIESEARKILEQHGLLSVPVDPVVVAAKEGIRVNHAVFTDELISGMITKRGDAVTLLVRESDQPYRKRFTIAHELGHYFLHLADQDGDRVDTTVDLFRSEPGKHEEAEANQFAAALLMPRELVEQEIAAHAGITLDDLAGRFRVSESAMGIRLDVLGFELPPERDVRRTIA